MAGEDEHLEAAYEDRLPADTDNDDTSEYFSSECDECEAAVGDPCLPECPYYNPSLENEQ